MAEPFFQLLLSREQNQNKGPKKRLTRGELRKERIKEALAKGEKVLTRKERRQAWAEKFGAQYGPVSQAGPSGSQAAQMTPVQRTNPSDQPADSVRPSASGVKRLHSYLTPEETGADKKRSMKKRQDTVGTKRPVESFAETSCAEKMAIVRVEHPDMKLTKDEATEIKTELSRRAFRSEGVRMTSCHLEGGAVVVGYVNASTKVWLEKQVEELAPIIRIQLKLGPAHLLLKLVKVSTFVPKTTGAEDKTDVMMGLKHQSGLDTDNRAVVGGKTNSDG